MIVRRWTVPWMTTKSDDVLDLLKEVRELFPAPHAVRIYRPRFAQYGKYIVEHEFESMEAMQRWIAQFLAEVPQDVWKDWNERMDLITETDQSIEVWELVE